MKTILVSLTVVAALAGCKDRGACLQAHFENSGYWQPMYTTVCNGTSCSSQFSYMYYVDTSGNVCDQWQYPDGKPEDK